MAAILTTAAWAAAKQHSHLRAETVVGNASSSQSGDEDSIAARGPKLEKKKANKRDDHNAHTKRVQPTSKQQLPDGTPNSRTFPTIIATLIFSEFLPHPSLRHRAHGQNWNESRHLNRLRSSLTRCFRAFHPLSSSSFLTSITGLRNLLLVLHVVADHVWVLSQYAAQAVAQIF